MTHNEALLDAYSTRHLGSGESVGLAGIPCGGFVSADLGKSLNCPPLTWRTTLYSILRAAKRVPREPVAFSPELLVPGFWAIDLETRGVDASDPGCSVVGIGLANEKHCFYVDLVEVRKDLRTRFALLKFLKNSSFTAFNVMFDGTFLQAAHGEWFGFVGCSYGLFKQLAGEGFNGQSWSLETAQGEVLGWPTSNKTALEAALKERGLTKADMWQLPAEILGPYSASDADAAWQLWEELTKQAEPFPQVLDYHERIFLPQVRLLAEQQLRGMRIDQELLKTCHSDLLAKIDHAMKAFLNHSDVAHHIEAYDQAVLDAWIASEPPHQTKAGTESARWVAWRDRKLPLFNPNSKQQLAWLFYEKLGNKARKFTETGRQVVDRKVLPTLGEPGKLLNEYNLLVKRRGYVEAVIEKSFRDGLIHPQFNSVGTVTTRLGGSGGLNLQQMPKVVDFLAAFTARPGHVLVQADAEALEPTILAEFSQDKTLLTLYGKDAKQNDIYLFVAAKIPALGKEIVKYYDPENPTPEGIKAAKKHCKRDRAIAKTVVLAANYNAGAPKIHETLLLGGIDISLREVREILAGYWRLFGGVKAFERTLQEMWVANEGWVPSVLGTPICVAPQYLKDINNRFCQTSGHQILQLWIANVERLRQERGVQMTPWLVDMHDETLWECPEGQAEAAVLVIKDALAATNEELGMGIPIKGPPMIADNLAAIKCGEDYNEWLAGRTA